MRDLPPSILPVIGIGAGAGAIAWGLSLGENDEGIGLVWAGVFCLISGLGVAWYMWKHPNDLDVSSV